MLVIQRLPHYIHLMRLEKPIGIWLLLWPTLWALWLAGQGHPDSKLVCIFILGVILTRSLGCVINDIADRDFDGKVARTQHRPLATGKVSLLEAMLLVMSLTFCAFLLVLMCNGLTIALAFVAVLLAAIYPFMKRITHLPQFVLGAAFAMGMPMAFAAMDQELSFSVWFIYATGVVWPLIYDTMYAMADREDDLKIGVKSMAILLGQWDIVCIALLQVLFMSMLIIIGWLFHLRVSYFASLGVVASLCIYQQWLIKRREPKNCLLAFKNNAWIGCWVFLGIVTNYW